MSDKDKEEYEKCLKSPWYFATKYLRVKDPYTGKLVHYYTPLSEEEFNEKFKNLKLVKSKI